jgi:uncharacterized membrane protein
MKTVKHLPTAVALFLSALLFLLGSCASPDPYVQRGRVGGTVIGGVTGAVIGNNTGLGSWGGAAIGAGLGAILGDTAGKSNSMYYRSRTQANPQYPMYRY